MNRNSPTGTTWQWVARAVGERARHEGLDEAQAAALARDLAPAATGTPPRTPAESVRLQDEFVALLLEAWRAKRVT